MRYEELFGHIRNNLPQKTQLSVYWSVIIQVLAIQKYIKINTKNEKVRSRIATLQVLLISWNQVHGTLEKLKYQPNFKKM